MTASPETLAAFEAWKLAELASHYAAPCDDDLMDQLTDTASERFNDLMFLPTAGADDMLLKLFPVLLRELEPKRFDPPLRPGNSQAYGYDTAFYQRLLADLCAASASIADAMSYPPNKNYEEDAA